MSNIYHMDDHKSMISAIEQIGRVSLDAYQSLHETLVFAGRVMKKIIDGKTYNSATRGVLLNQIYFTAVQILPLFLMGSIVFGTLLIGVVFQMITDLGLADYLGNILVGLLVIELAPLITALLIALRSGSAINAEIAVMKVNQELKTLEAFNIDLTEYLFIPRIINGVLSVSLLTSLFSVVVLISGLLFSNLMFGMSFDAYANVLLDSTNLTDMILSIVKAAAFGFFITIIPIKAGLNATRELTSIPVSVMNGMVKVFIAIILIEVLSLIVRMI
jgi:phospholipid/cholesterol/gamma-HCH transport system permease protein